MVQTMSFFNQVLHKWNEANLETPEMRYLKQLTEMDKIAIEYVRVGCLNRHNDILAAAEKRETRYKLYAGPHLAFLNRADIEYSCRLYVIKSIENSIRSHYGDGFKVSHSDESPHDQSYQLITFTVSWGSD
jgi:hypothetical protein